MLFFVLFFFPFFFHTSKLSVIASPSLRLKGMATIMLPAQRRSDTIDLC